jgi:hypothetical protein
MKRLLARIRWWLVVRRQRRLVRQLRKLRER